MKVGIVAEGPSDVAVLRNILKGRLALDRKDVLPIRPELAEDETDLGAPGRSGAFRPLSAERFSNWALVLKECQERTKIRTFLDNLLDEDRFVIVHIDTAEAEERGYDIVRPQDRKADNYTEELCGRLHYLMNDRKSLRLRGKGNRGVPRRSAYDLYHELTVDFRDSRKLDACAHRNRSLRLFVDSL